jgi:hypothetical protein
LKKPFVHRLLSSFATFRIWNGLAAQDPQHLQHVPTGHAEGRNIHHVVAGVIFRAGERPIRL